MTMMVPKTMESATSRFGFLTSAAVKPMLFHASAENSDPTWATASASSSPYQPSPAVTVGITLFRRSVPGAIVFAARTDHKCEKLSAIAAPFLATNTHRKITPSSDSIFAEVKMFWIHFPSFTPRVLRNVRKMIISTATSCCTDKLTANFDEKLIGGTIHTLGDIAGNNTPR